MEKQQKYLDNGLQKTRAAARELARCDDAAIRSVLYSLADKTLSASKEILEANRSDLFRIRKATLWRHNGDRPRKTAVLRN